MLYSLVRQSWQHFRFRSKRIYRIHWNRFTFSQIQVHCEVGRFVVKTVNTQKELKEASKLRLEVAKVEPGLRTLLLEPGARRNCQAYDQIIVVDKRIGKIVGSVILESSGISNPMLSTR
jgi:hypothetical protein